MKKRAVFVPEHARHGMNVDEVRHLELRALLRYLESRHVALTTAWERERAAYKLTAPPSRSNDDLRRIAARRYRLAMWVLEQLGASA